MKTLTKAVLAIAFLSLVGDLAVADHVPVFEDRLLDYRGRLALLMDYEDFDPIVEIEGSYDENEFLSTMVTLGSYYRVHKNLKVGAFYRLQLGVRHEDDWIDSPSGWIWEDTQDRLENVFILDVTPRAQLDFIPGENWVVSLKGRYLFNTFNSHQSLKLRPGLTYFWIKDRQPILNASVNYELYLALNFSDVLLYERWPYLNVLYHVSPSLMLETSLARKSVTWTTAQEVKDMSESPYEVTDKTLVLGFGVIYRLGL